MNIQLEDIDFNAFDNLANLIKNYKIEYLSGQKLENYQIRKFENIFPEVELSGQQILKVLKLKNELKVKWIDRNISATFFALGSWADAAWGIAKVYPDFDFDSSIVNREIHEWEKVKNGDWYYFLYE